MGRLAVALQLLRCKMRPFSVLMLASPLIASPFLLTPSFLGAGTAAFITLGSTTITVAEVAPLLGLASLGAVVKGAAIKGLKLRAALSKREAEGADEEVDGFLSLLKNVEPEDCYKRTFCALATGEVVNWRMTRLLNLLDEADVFEGSSSKSESEERRPHDKLLQAAEYGAARNIAKCETRYQCTFSLAEIERLYQN